MGSRIVEKAMSEGAAFLSEAESKKLLAEFGVPIGKQLVTRSLEEALSFARGAGYPLVIKGSGRTLLHKTEMGLVEVGIRDEGDLRARFAALLQKLPAEADGILLSPQYDNRREFIAGLSNDPQFGPVVMFGLGGIFTEALKDVVFRVAPIMKADAEDMLDGIQSASLLGSVRGLPAADREKLCDILLAVSRIGTEVDGVTEIDINPILFDGQTPVAADALVKLGKE